MTTEVKRETRAAKMTWTGTTEFSPDRRYRYTLFREWDMQYDLVASQGGPGFDNTNRFVMFIGLNPSTADERKNDPTVRRCIDFAQRWGYGALCMTNLFAFRATNPKVMLAQHDPVGSENDWWLMECAAHANIVVAAWGAWGYHTHRDAQVMRFVPNLHCLRKTKGGFPGHPLYAPSNLTPVPFP